jgi:type IV pilus assembly protein PilY1
LQSLFIDGFGQFREDSNGDGKLTYIEDSIIETSYNKEKKRAEASRCTSNAEGKKGACVIIGDLEAIKPLWEGGSLLAKRDPSTRNIWTWVDQGSMAFVKSEGAMIGFESASANTLKPYLRATSDTESGNIIKFIRGEKVTNYRDRQKEVGGVSYTWKLGDIINSEPVVVGSPSEDFDKKYGDRSYTRFFSHYRNRRRVVYVGANDGMLHAFNGGFYRAGDDPSTTTVEEHGRFTKSPSSNDGTPLGEERWAFIPQELLPHLKLLTASDYDKNKHYYFVDGTPRVLDARIFANDVDHPYGWGTILIASMRMGGGLLPVDVNGNGNKTDAGEDRFRSAYVAFDITNPEKNPELLWVFKDHDLGFTTGVPAIVRINKDTWYAVFGSGPLSYQGVRENTSIYNRFNANASEYGQIYVVNLKTGELKRKEQIDITDRYALMGDPSAFDLQEDYNLTTGDQDYIDDVIYVGKAYGPRNPAGAVAWRGKMHRILTYGQIEPVNWTYSVLFNPDKPILARPTVTQDKNHRPWVLFGTGRLFTSGINSDQQDRSFGSMYGIKEGGPNGCWDSSATTATSSGTTAAKAWKPTCSNQVFLDGLFDSSTVAVKEGGLCTGGVCTGDVKTIFDLADQVINNSANPQGGKDGWLLNLLEGERVLSKVTLYSGVVASPTYTPSFTDGVCATLGSSVLQTVYYETGTAFANLINKKGVFDKLDASGSVLRSNASILINANGANEASNRGLGEGIASRAGILVHKNQEGQLTATINANTSSGVVARQVINLDVRSQGMRLFMDKVE